MKLSKNFSLSEFTRSETAEKLDIDNTPNEEQIENIRALVENILQPLRDNYGKPIKITSGYRSKKLCKAIGSSEKSQHAKGEAADFEVVGIDNKEAAEWIADNLEFDQLILEYYVNGVANSGWIHCSYSKDRSRKETLSMIRGVGYVPGIIGVDKT